MREYSGAEKELMEQLGSICHNSNKSKNCIKYQTDAKWSVCLLLTAFYHVTVQLTLSLIDILKGFRSNLWITLLYSVWIGRLSLLVPIMYGVLTGKFYGAITTYQTFPTLGKKM